MSRSNIVPDVLSAAALWREKCLLGDGSVLTSEQLWISPVINNLVDHFVKDPDESTADFLAKLEKQLSDAPPEAVKLAAEMIWFMYLFVSTSSIAAETKLRHIKRVWEWSKSPLPLDSPLLNGDALSGVGAVGTAYFAGKFRELAFLINFMAIWKALPIERRQTFASDGWAFAAWLYALPESKGRQLRHIILYLLFPDIFERISSGRNKRQIVERLWKASGLPAEPQVSDPVAVDRALLQIRQTIEKELGKEMDFYSSPVVERWQEEAAPPVKPVGDEDRAWAAKRLGSSRVWAIGCGKDASLWSRFRRDGEVAIGWEELGDLNEFVDKTELTQALQKSAGPGSGSQKNNSLACWQFAQEIEQGDIVIAHQGRSTLFGYGKVESDYIYDAKKVDYPNMRKVAWKVTGKWEIPREKQMTTKTLTEMTPYISWLKYAFEMMDGKTPKESGKPDIQRSSYTKQDALNELFMTAEELDGMMTSIAQKKALMLVGPPGVGKTYVAKRLAWLLLQTSEPSQRLEMVQFHAGYAYEDFVQGWRPTANGAFALKDGKFKQFCDRAAEDQDVSIPYVFCIDEINRANLGKVFGEVMVLLEADKRGPAFALPLQYAAAEASRFFIPENVYLIGMMNTADRSIAMVDYALRRRFAFHQISPAISSEAFHQFLVDRGVDEDIISKIASRIGNLNEAIRADRNLGTGYEVGHSFFCPSDTEEEPDEDWYRRIVEREVGPLLREYWFDQPELAEDRIRDLLM